MHHINVKNLLHIVVTKLFSSFLFYHATIYTTLWDDSIIKAAESHYHHLLKIEQPKLLSQGEMKQS